MPAKGNYTVAGAKTGRYHGLHNHAYNTTTLYQVQWERLPQNTRQKDQRGKKSDINSCLPNTGIDVHFHSISETPKHMNKHIKNANTKTHTNINNNLYDQEVLIWKLNEYST